MKYTLLYLGLLFVTLILGSIIMTQERPRKSYLLLVDVLFASVILGLLIAHLTRVVIK
jgi:hypothetical protein